jgi:hypothetical protein
MALRVAVSPDFDAPRDREPASVVKGRGGALARRAGGCAGFARAARGMRAHARPTQVSRVDGVGLSLAPRRDGGEAMRTRTRQLARTEWSSYFNGLSTGLKVTRIDLFCESVARALLVAALGLVLFHFLLAR